MEKAISCLEIVYKFVDKKIVDTTDMVYYHSIATLNVAFEEN